MLKVKFAAMMLAGVLGSLATSAMAADPVEYAGGVSSGTAGASGTYTYSGTVEVEDGYTLEDATLVVKCDMSPENTSGVTHTNPVPGVGKTTYTTYSQNTGNVGPKNYIYIKYTYKNNATNVRTTKTKYFFP